VTLRLLFCSAAACGMIVFAQTAPPAGATQGKFASGFASGVDQAWSILNTGVKDQSAEKRSQAVGALGLLVRQARAQKMAEAALADTNSEVRTAAAHSLGEMAANGSIAALKNALADSDPGVVLAAASSLLAMNDPAAFAVYYEVLTGQRKAQGKISQEMKALHDPKKMAELGIQGGVSFVPFGGLGFGMFKFFTKDQVSPVRASAAAALSKDPDDQSGQALSEAVNDDKWLVEVAAIHALALRGDKKYLDAVSAKMSADRPIVSYTAAAAVIRLNAKAAAPRKQSATRR
jgi:hypothetical protein